MKNLLCRLTLFFVCAGAAFAQTTIQPILGNPSSGADSDENNRYVAHQNYLLSYNKSRGAANWVTWHLSKSDIGSFERSNSFAPDLLLPTDSRIRPVDYLRSGYDRGHLCPSKDRSSDQASNVETFLMSNMQPQSPKLNQKTWRFLEEFTRETVGRGNEAYVYAGCYGDKGRIKDKITIPTNCYKIIVFLPEGSGDLQRIDEDTQIVAVDMPNDETIINRWRRYVTTVDEIETKTGYDFLSTLPETLQITLESKKNEQ